MWSKFKDTALLVQRVQVTFIILPGCFPSIQVPNPGASHCKLTVLSIEPLHCLKQHYWLWGVLAVYVALFLGMSAYSVIVGGLCCHFSGYYKLPIAFSNVTWTCTWNQQTLQISTALSQARGTSMLPETTANCDWEDKCKQEKFLMTECNLKCKDRAHSYFGRF